MTLANVQWTNPSVIEFSEGQDPVSRTLQKASEVVLNAMDQGWSGPPFDPAQLAELLGITIIPNAQIRDARTTIDSRGTTVIEFNPNRSSSRVRFNIAHEVAHTLFPDFGARVRYRDHHKSGEATRDDWELEVLCNLAAGEFLMPQGTLPSLEFDDLSIDTVVNIRERFRISAEAVLIRLLNLVEYPLVVFAASPSDDVAGSEYRVDYAMTSPRTWQPILRGQDFERTSIVGQCSAIGYTAKGYCATSGSHSPLWFECLGVPPVPGFRTPRVVGLARQDNPTRLAGLYTEVVGDALEARSPGDTLILHVVNDKTPNWGGGGVANLVKKRWPAIANEFKRRYQTDKTTLQLGNVEFDVTPEGARIGHMVAQHGYGPSAGPRIRYGALKRALDQACAYALEHNLEVQMPAIGSGNAGGNWAVIADLIKEALCSNGIKVTVCSLSPRASSPQSVQRAQPSLF